MKVLKISLTVVVELALIYLFFIIGRLVIYGGLFPWEFSDIRGNLAHCFTYKPK